MNKKGFELAISTLILITLGVLVLIGFAYSLTAGFSKLKSGGIDSTQGEVIKITCETACLNEEREVYCCKDFDYGDSKLKCNDDLLGIDCDLSCEDFACE